jgi:light-regulated signal transduction histidine kinase (bacteriophytochrome)
MNKEIMEHEGIEALQHALAERTSQLEAVTHELEKFTYSVSHDLRAPLRAIEGFSRILLEDYTDKLDEEGKRYLKVLDASSHKMTRLLDDLLQLSRLGRQEMNLAPVDMRELVTSVWDELKSKFPSRQIDLKIGQLPNVSGDAALLRHVWGNLLSNAIKFTASRTPAKIEISGKEEPDQVVYCIKDNGVGFDMRAAKKLFGVFQRLHTEEEFAGSGTGLAIVQRLVRRHAGEVWVDAKIDEGAAFYFTLPRVEASNRYAA